tara:strand:- start:2145 stop:3122 length:978 start_codon:yes stop_codon:yes gene_type:complete
MIIKYFEVNKVIKNNINLFLFYGKNEGLQNETIENNFTNKFDGIINKYEETEFINNFEIIINEIITKSLFDNKKIIVVSRTTDKIIKYIEEVLKRDLADIKIIFKSGTLEKKSKLRTHLEKNDKAYVVPFYEDNLKSLSNIVVDFLNKNKIRISTESINLLISRASGNRDNLKTELEKILNYSMSKKIIDFETVKKLTNLSENIDVSELADNFLKKNKKNISKILNENNFSDEDCVLILRTILAKSKRLMDIIERLEMSKNIDQVISLTKPPVFWKDKENVKIQANKWILNELKNKIFQISEIETLIKTNSKNSLNLLSDFIINN